MYGLQKNTRPLPHVTKDLVTKLAKFETAFTTKHGSPRLITHCIYFTFLNLIQVFGIIFLISIKNSETSLFAAVKLGKVALVLPVNT
jgi:hypothetical protein